MNVLVLGSGGREHAIVQKLRESPRVTALYALPGNGGMEQEAVCAPVRATDLDGVAAFALEHRIDFTVVTPDDPLAMGMVDRLEAEGIPCFGPTKAAARIESSKLFAKELMNKYGIPTARYRRCESEGEAMAALAAADYPIVVKADGLALGKGVVVAPDRAAAEKAVHEMMGERKFGKSGERILLEECLTGPEVSVLCLTDGVCVRPLISAMDHKRALDGDLGPNTGGMGAIAPSPYYTEALAARCMETIFQPTVAAMAKEGCPFSGCLYFGLMLTRDGPKVIEFNCRFGDPETQAVLPLLESDLLEAMLAVREKRLAQAELRFSNRHACCVVMASGGYPAAYETGKRITMDAPDALLFHAGTKRDASGFVTAGGRVLGVTALGDTRGQARQNAYAAVARIHFDRAHFRKDIGER